jgi:PAS domain S-box-containing protein
MTRYAENGFRYLFNSGLDRAYVVRIALQIGAVILVIFILVLFWNQQIRRREERFRGLTEHSTDIILSFREDGVITYQSPSHKQILGYSPNHLVGKSVFDLVHRDELVQWQQILLRLRQGGGSETFVHRFREQQGQYRYFEFNCLNLLNNNALNAFVLNGRDLSERIQVEADLQKAKEQAETASKIKSEFLASMSHEIRTPLNAILGMMEITLRSPLKKEQKQNLRVAKEAAEHLLAIINDILDLSKIEAGKLVVKAVDFDFLQFLESIVRTYRDEAGKKGLQLELKHASNVPRWVNGDPLRLRQILINLVGNALKFTRTGTITISVNLKEGSAQVAAAPVLPMQFEVRDRSPNREVEKKCYRKQKQLLWRH